MSRSSASAPMRVLHFLWHGETGGKERAVYELAREQMSDPAVSPGLLFAQPRGPYWERGLELGCPIVSLDLPNGRAVRQVGRAVGPLRDFSIHHFHSAEPLLMLASLRCPGARRLYTHRGGSKDYKLRKRVRFRLTGQILRRSFHGFSGNTQHAGRFAAGLYGLPPGQFTPTYNGVDFSLLEPTRPAGEVRAEVGLAPDDFVVGTAAHLLPLKRIDLLIRAAHAVGRDDVRVLVLGEGGELERLKALARDLGFDAAVVFPGVRNDMGNYLQVMDAFCLPSDSSESFGNAAVEAMGMGVPTIVLSDSPGLAEHIVPGRTGYIVEDQEALSATLGALIDDPESGRAVGEAGRAAVRARYRPDAAATRYRDLYRSL